MRAKIAIQSLVLILLLATSASADLTTNLVAYWKFDDASGGLADAVNSHDGSATGSVKYDTTGIINTGIGFHDANLNERFEVADHDDFTVTAFSISVWVRCDTNGVAYSVCQKYDSDSAVGFAIQADNSPRVWDFSVWGATVDAASSTGADSVKIDTWQHIVGTRSSGGAMKIYVDGTLQTDQPTVTGEVGGTTVLKIGVSYIDAKDFGGIIDEMGFWTRELTESEVTELYNSGSGLAYPFSSSESVTYIRGAYLRGVEVAR